ncbi:hypothetical protein ACEYYA_12915 [Paracoccus sp. p3-h83]|uniref:hypothetical protein n=1 Tax=Paracoccus sp. p3-h83 TaxID=3342805 RepID=UPI0035BA9777
MSEAVAALVGAIVGSGIVVLREWLAGKVDGRKRARYLAIRVVITLDRFVDECAIVSLDNGHLEGFREEATATTKDPSPIDFPEDVDWRSIDHQMAYDLLSLDNKLHDARQAINAAADFSSPPDYDEYFETRRYRYALLGLEAARLARILRDTHDLPRRTFGEWNPEIKLQENRKEIEAERERHKALSSDIL